MPIDRDQLYEDIMFWLGSLPNTLSEEEIRKLMEFVITQVGDDESNYAEILCTALRAVAIRNDSQITVSAGSIKRERVGRLAEIEYFEGTNTQGVWDKFIERLKDICPLFGYIPPRAFGIKISPGKKIRSPDCGCK